MKKHLSDMLCCACWQVVDSQWCHVLIAEECCHNMLLEYSMMSGSGLNLRPEQSEVVIDRCA